MTAALKVLPEQAQDCSTCQMMKRCWSTSARYVAINVLICRMHRNIDQSKATAQLLELLRPKIGKIVQGIMRNIGAVSPDPYEVESDVRAAIVEYLLVHYQMGELAFPLYFLFGGKSGVMYRWSLAYAAKVRRSWKDTYPIGNIGPNDDGELEARLARVNAAATDGAVSGWSPHQDPEHETHERLDGQGMVEQAMRIVQDGTTFSLAEYRVLAFCLRNANDRGARRPIDGLHAFLADQMGVPRSRVTRLFREATETLTEMM